MQNTKKILINHNFYCQLQWFSATLVVLKVVVENTRTIINMMCIKYSHGHVNCQSIKLTTFKLKTLTVLCVCRCHSRNNSIKLSTTYESLIINIIKENFKLSP